MKVKNESEVAQSCPTLRFTHSDKRVPGIPQSDNYGGRGDGRPGLKIPLVSGGCQPPGAVTGTGVYRI